MKTKTFSEFDEASVGHALRHHIFNKITPILLSTDLIGDTNARLMIQANCLDMVSLLEEIIEQFNLDQKSGA